MGLLVVFPLSSALAILTKKKFEEMSFFSVCIVIFNIILSGLFGSTIYGVYVDVLLVIASIMICIRSMIKDRDGFKSAVYTSGSFALILFYIIGAAMYGGYALIGSDVDRVYGPQIANMWMYDDLGGDLPGWEWTLLYVAPIVPSWSYFCLKFWPYYSDGICMMAYFIYCITALLPIFKYVKKKEWIKFLLLFVAVFSIFNLNYEESIGVYYLDTATAVTAIFGFTMVVEAYKEKTDIVYMLEAAASLIIISVIKRVGGATGFAMTSCLAFFTFEKLFGNGRTKESLRVKMVPTLCMFSASVISCGFGIYRWQKGQGSLLSSYTGVLFFLAWYVTGIICWSVKEFFARKKYLWSAISIILISFGSLSFLRYFFDRKNGEGYFCKVLRIFCGVLFNASEIDGIEIFHWNKTPFPIIVVVLTAIGMIIFTSFALKDADDDTEKWKNISVSLVGSYLFWLILWLAMYLYHNREDLNYVYCSIRYMCAGPMTICSVLIYGLVRRPKIRNYLFLFLLTVFIFMSAYKYQEDVFIAKLCQGRKEYFDVYEKAGLKLTPEESIFYISTVSRSESDYYPYFSFPALFGTIPGRRYSKKSEQITINELEDTVSRYDYVFIDSVDDEFKKSYNSIFDDGIDNIKNNSIYKVNTDEGVKLELLASGDKEYISNLRSLE